MSSSGSSVDVLEDAGVVPVDDGRHGDILMSDDGRAYVSDSSRLSASTSAGCGTATID